MLVLRTFPKLVGRSIQNLMEIGQAVHALKVVMGPGQKFLTRVGSAIYGLD